MLQFILQTYIHIWIVTIKYTEYLLQKLAALPTFSNSVILIDTVKVKIKKILSFST